MLTSLKPDQVLRLPTLSHGTKKHKSATIPPARTMDPSCLSFTETLDCSFASSARIKSAPAAAIANPLTVPQKPSPLNDVFQNQNS